MSLDMRSSITAPDFNQTRGPHFKNESKFTLKVVKGESFSEDSRDMMIES